MQLNHRRQGSGPPMLLLHGVGHHLQGWDPVAARLAERFEVVATDSPGFGRSAPLPPGGPPTIDRYVDAFAAFLAEQGLDRPHAAGNSMGGGIALELARRGLVRSVCAISPIGFWTAAEARYCRFTLDAVHRMPAPARRGALALARRPRGRRALFAQVLLHGERLPPAEAASTLGDLWGSPVMSEVLAAFTSYRCAPGVPGPVTIAWGEGDRLLPHRLQAPRARQVLPEATHVTLEGVGHTPFAEDPALVAATVMRSTEVQGMP